MSGPNPDDVIAAAHRDDNTGFCLECGEEHSGIEPDAEGYECEVCGAHAVAGAEQAILLGAV